MKHINKIFIFAMVATFLCACSDFLEKEPLSQGTDAIFFKTPEQFAQAANGLYDMEAWQDYNKAPAYYKMDQGMDTHGFGNNGGASAGEADFRWEKPYEYIRKCNVLLQKSEEYAGNRDDIAASVGAAYFFRAWQHFYLLQYFGGVPIADHVVTLDGAVLYGPRSSRYEVADFIIKDLREAIIRLPKETTIANNDKGKVSKEAAQSFLARFLLYEATWEKYVPNIGYDLDGDGTSAGAGSVKPTGYPSVTEMLTEAKTLAGEVITEAETGTFQLWQECDSLSYFYLFNIDDKNNIPNPWNKGKSTNKEFIFSKKYDFDLLRGGINLSHTVYTWQATNISAIFGESFLCHNGLPIRISHTGDIKDAQNNPEFQGYDNFMSEFQNRDFRFTGSTFLPDRPVWTSRTEDGRQLTELGKPYPDPVYPKPSDTFDPTDNAHNSKNVIYTPLIGLNSTHNGYGSRKFGIEGNNRATAGMESADFPLIRLAEVHLIYSEATCELGNGSISDGDLNFSINKNRARAGVAPLTNALIANVWDAGWWDHEQNKTVCKKMNMLDEIRRERACELFGEGFRENDLKRWGIAHINLKGQKLGRKIYGTAYMTAKANDNVYFGQMAYDPDTRPTANGIYEGSGPDDPDYGRPIATLTGNTHYSQRDYLRPVPLTQIRLNNALTQNPGW